MNNFKTVLVLAGIVLTIIAGMSAIPSTETATTKSVAASERIEKENKLAQLNKLAKERNRELSNAAPDRAVSDLVAIGTFLNFIGNADSPAEIQKTDSYLTNGLNIKNSRDRSTLISIAKKYASTTFKIQQDAAKVERNDEKLRELTEEKGKLLKSLVREMKSGLSPEGWNTFKDTILIRVKPQIKVIRQNQGKLTK